MMRQPTNLGTYGYTKFKAVPTLAITDMSVCFSQKNNCQWEEASLIAQRLDATFRSTLVCALQTYDRNDDMTFTSVNGRRQVHVVPRGAVSVNAKQVDSNPRFRWHIGTNYMKSELTEDDFDVYVNMGGENVVIWVIDGSHLSWVNESLTYAASNGVGHRICPLVFNASAYCGSSNRLVIEPGEMVIADSRLIRQECKECTLGSKGALVFYGASLKESPEQKLPEQPITLSDTYRDLLHSKETEWDKVVCDIYTELS